MKCVPLISPELFLELQMSLGSLSSQQCQPVLRLQGHGDLLSDQQDLPGERGRGFELSRASFRFCPQISTPTSHFNGIFEDEGWGWGSVAAEQTFQGKLWSAAGQRRRQIARFGALGLPGSKPSVLSGGRVLQPSGLNFPHLHNGDD